MVNKSRAAPKEAGAIKRKSRVLPALPALVLAVGAAFSAAAEEIIVSHGVSNFGELKYPADFKHLDYVNPNAPKGGEISQSSIGNFDTFNNYTRKGVAAAPIGLFENILTSTADDPYGTYCYLCTTMEYPESRDWVIFNLRDDVTFSDGSPLTAEDIKFSFDLYQEQGLPEFLAVIEGFVESIEVLDTHRIKFNFTEQAPRREVIGFAGGFPAWSKAWFEADEKRRLDEPSLEPFLGTGPYVIDSYDVGRQIIYKRNPNFWGADHPFNIGQNNFDSIRIEYFGDSAAAFEAFKAGEYTFRNENNSKQWGTAYDFPGVQDGHVKVEALPDGTIGYAQSFIFNLDRETWQDKQVRAALGMMFNFEWSNETLFYGLYERVNSFWENSPLEATGTPSEAELALLKPLADEGLIDAAILTEEALMAPESGARPLDRRNLRTASAMLDAAGWEIGDDGMRVKNGKRLTANILSFSPAFDRIINPYVENLKRLGVDAQLDRVDRAQYTERRRSGDFDMVVHGFSMGFEPGFGLGQWYGSATASDSSRNLMRLRHPGVDKLIENVVAAKTLEELTTSTHALDRVLRYEQFWVPQWFKDVHTVAYYDMYRYPDPLPPLALGEISFWWYDADAHQALKDAGALD